MILLLVISKSLLCQTVICSKVLIIFQMIFKIKPHVCYLSLSCKTKHADIEINMLFNYLKLDIKQHTVNKS